MEPKIVVGENIFKNNTLMRLNNSNYRLQFIKIADNKYTIELHGVDPLSYRVVGKMIDGKAEFSGDLFHAEIIEEEN